MEIEEILRNGMYIIFVYIIKEFLDILLIKKKHRKNFQLFIWLCYGCLQFILAPYIHNPINSIFFNVSLLLGVISILYNGTMKTKIIVSFSFITIWSIVELLTGYILIMLNVNTYTINELGAAISKIILLVVLKIFRRKKYATSLKDISLQYWSLLFVLPSCSIFVIYNFYILEYKQKIYVRFSGTISILLILILNLMLYKIYDKLSEEAEIEKRNCIYEKQIQLCTKQIQERKERDLEIQELRHNIKGYLICMNEYVRQNRIDMLEKYISDIYTSLSDKKKICTTGNIVIDSMINFKYGECLKNSINFETEIQIPAHINFDNVDLSVILGNALDNAIEGTLKLDKDKRYIHIKMLFYQGNLLIEITNSFNGIIKRGLNGTFLTVKDDSVNHGIGLSIIEKSVVKYQGLVLPEAIGGTFKLTVLLYDI